MPLCKLLLRIATGDHQQPPPPWLQLTGLLTTTTLEHCFIHQEVGSSPNRGRAVVLPTRLNVYRCCVKLRASEKSVSPDWFSAQRLRHFQSSCAFWAEWLTSSLFKMRGNNSIKLVCSTGKCAGSFLCAAARSQKNAFLKGNLISSQHQAVSRAYRCLTNGCQYDSDLN